ncbi:hypothetical protein AVEN_153139-1, partial [Araneus ventricosus]
VNVKNKNQERFYSLLPQLDRLLVYACVMNHRSENTGTMLSGFKGQLLSQ